VVALAGPADVERVIGAEREAGRKVGSITMRATGGADESIALPANALGYAAGLYDALHTLDDAGCDVIVIERVPDDPSWMGVADRLRRAATR
jgi:L-threonylcarbamoyladenylate synthase